MDFADLNGDGEPDSGTASNSSSVNGGRASYIHYAEPYPVMVDGSHLGMGEDPIHMTFIATEVLETTNGTGLSYLLDTTEYTINGNSFTFQPKLLSSWEIPFGAAGVKAERAYPQITIPVILINHIWSITI